MQEVELQRGFFTPRVDGRGIDRLRFLAMQFEGMGRTKDDVSPSSLITARFNRVNDRGLALQATQSRVWAKKTRHMYCLVRQR